MIDPQDVLDIPYLTDEQIVHTIADCLKEKIDYAFGQDAEYWFDVMHNRDASDLYRMYGQWLVTLQEGVNGGAPSDREVVYMFRDHVERLLSEATPEQLKDWL